MCGPAAIRCVARFEAANRQSAISRSRSFSCNSLIAYLLAAGDPLVEAQREAEAGAGLRREGAVSVLCRHHYRAARADSDAAGLDAAISAASTMRQFDELRSNVFFLTDPAFALPSAGTGSASCKRASSPATMLRPSRRHRRRNSFSGSPPSFFETAEYHFYAALSLAARCDSAPADRAPASPRGSGRPPPAARGLGGALPENFARPRGAGRRRDRPHRRPRRSMPCASTNRPSARPAPTALSTTRRSPMSWLPLLRRRGFETDRERLSAERPLRLSPLGSRWQGAATR